MNTYVCATCHKNIETKAYEVQLVLSQSITEWGKKVYTDKYGNSWCAFCNFVMYRKLYAAAVMIPLLMALKRRKPKFPKVMSRMIHRYLLTALVDDMIQEKIQTLRC